MTPAPLYPDGLLIVEGEILRPQPGILARIRNARARGRGLVITMTGGTQSSYVESKQSDGRFDLEKWRAAVVGFTWSFGP